MIEWPKPVFESFEDSHAEIEIIVLDDDTLFHPASMFVECAVDEDGASVPMLLDQGAEVLSDPSPIRVSQNQATGRLKDATDFAEE